MIYSDAKFVELGMTAVRVKVRDLLHSPSSPCSGNCAGPLYKEGNEAWAFSHLPSLRGRAGLETAMGIRLTCTAGRAGGEATGTQRGQGPHPSGLGLPVGHGPTCPVWPPRLAPLAFLPLEVTSQFHTESRLCPWGHW